MLLLVKVWADLLGGVKLRYQVSRSEQAMDNESSWHV